MMKKSQNYRESIGKPMKAFWKSVGRWTKLGAILGILTDLGLNHTLQEKIAEKINGGTNRELAARGELSQDVHLAERNFVPSPNDKLSPEEVARLQKELGIVIKKDTPSSSASGNGGETSASQPTEHSSAWKIIWGVDPVQNHKGLFWFSLIGFVVGVRKGVTKHREASARLDEHDNTVAILDHEYNQKIEGYKVNQQAAKERSQR